MASLVEIRPEQQADHDAIFRVVSQAFGRDDEARLVNELRKLPAFDASLSLVAVDEGDLVGHILFTDIAIRRADGESLAAVALAPLSVQPAHQRTGIGSRLTVAGIEACRARGDRLVIVVGHADYYPRFGFSSARARGLQAPFPVKDASFLVCELVPDGAPPLLDIAGLVEYPAPFLGV